MSAPADRPLLVYDGDCAFCRAWVARWRRTLGDRVEFEPYQSAAGRFPGQPLDRFRAAVHLREPGGAWRRGADAVFAALAHAPGGGTWARLYSHAPGFAAASEAAYAWVARHRNGLARATRLLWGEHVAPPGEALVSWAFLRAFALVLASAFGSAWAQVIGLVGERGVLPAARFLAAAHDRYGAAAYRHWPTLLWLRPADGTLHALCAAGLALSLLAAAGVWAGPALLAAWACYLSLAVAGQDFLWFQWDSLLLEMGFVAALLAPWRAWSAPGADEPARAPLRLLRWLLLRLMFASAAVKLSSGDPSWRHLTALTFHYQTQPLPPWTAWYAHHLPATFQRVSCAVMFACEGVAPLFLLGPRRVRFAATLAIAGLQALILATGNYGVFNLLSLALCLAMLDDGVWPSWARRLAWRPSRPDTPAARSRSVPAAIRRPVTVALFALSVPFVVTAWGVQPAWLAPLIQLDAAVEPLRLVNPYGLFAVMTTRRDEIVIEGSRDGVAWQPYEFRWKPGDVSRRPAFVTPHLPRLDWQMWFAALSDWRESPWLVALEARLLERSPPVRALFAREPFAGDSLRFVRATLWDYRFTTAAERRATGAWWHRERLGAFGPTLVLDRGRIEALLPPDTGATPF